MIGFATTAMYSLPYMKSVFYDPMREALSLNHKQLGNLLSIYGIVATVSYFPGGWLADKYSAKKLVSFSLIREFWVCGWQWHQVILYYV